jgi:plasmid stability protein
MPTKAVQPQDKYIVRLPDGMRDRLKDEAAKNNRSMNAEIISRLEQTLHPDFNGLDRKEVEALPRITFDLAIEAEQNAKSMRALIDILELSLDDEDVRAKLRAVRDGRKDQTKASKA